MLNKHNFLFSLSTLALCSLLAAHTNAWQTPQTPEVPQNQSQPAPDRVSAVEPKNETTIASDESYRIGPGDILDITTSKQPDYSQQGVRVDDNGMIQIPRDDIEVRAACRTAREVADEIKGRYARYLRKPYVYVQVKEFLSKPVSITGAVVAPGQFQLQRRIRLRELLARVNGPSERAGGTVQIFRSPDGAMCDSPPAEKPAAAGDMLTIYSLKSIYSPAEEVNPYLRPGDMVVVPDAEQAFIIGAIKTPAPIALKERITVSEAIARSGGLLPDANSEKIRIIRHVPGASSKTEFVANLKAISRHQQEDIVLQPNDIIEVPGASGAKKFFGQLMKSMVPLMTSVAY